MARFLKNRSKSKGKAPGSLIFIGKQKMDESCMSLIQYNGNTISEFELESSDNLGKHIRKESVTWINVYGLHDLDLIEKVGKQFNLTGLTLENILNTDQRPKIIEGNNYLMIIIKSIAFDSAKKSLKSEQITFILGENFLITFQEKRVGNFDHVRERLRNGVGRGRELGADYLCYVLLDTLVDNYIINIELLGDLIEQLDDKVIKLENNNIVSEIYRHKTEISYIRKAVRPAKEITNHLIKTESLFIKPETISYLNDLDDLVKQALDAIEIYFTMTSDQLNIYHAGISNRANEVMKVLTIFSAIFIPLTFIVGVYGTNFDVLPELHLKYGYFYMWGVIVLVIVLMLRFFKRRKWL